MEISWKDTRYVSESSDDPTGDVDLRGEYSVAISVRSGEISAIHNEIECARRLKMLSRAGDLYCPVPGSTHALKLAGIDTHGTPVWRVIANGRVCDAIPADLMAQMDPSMYSQAGPTAMKTIAWMRAVGRITSDWKTKDETWHVLHVWDEITLKESKLQFCLPEAQTVAV